MSELLPTDEQSRPNDRYRKVETPPGLLPCRFCGSPSELWQRWEVGDIWYSFGACTNLEDVDGEPCHFHQPDSVAFYKPRKVEAVRYWNLIMAARPHEADVAARHERELDEAMKERDYAQDVLQDVHIVLGGDGEWKGKLPPQEPPDSGDLHLDVPALARERMAELAAWHESCTGRHGSQSHCVEPATLTALDRSQS